MRRHALVDTLLLGHQAAGDIELKFQQLERIQAVAQEIRRRWNVAFESSSLANKALQAARRALDPLDVMLH
jgi:hypothetical protein